MQLAGICLAMREYAGIELLVGGVLQDSGAEAMILLQAPIDGHLLVVVWR